jgi:hypothetical protein
MEHMDLSKLKNCVFTAAISTGDRDKSGLLVSTLRGPFDFHEMVEYVYDLWNKRMDNAKVVILNKKLEDKIEWLDAKTIDYIIAKAPDILLEEVLLMDKEFTCEAGVVTEAEDDKAQ